MKELDGRKARISAALAPGVYPIVDPDQAQLDPYHLTRSLLTGGACIVQLRAKTMDAEAMTKLAIRLRTLCEQVGALLVINDRVDVALAAGAHGVHLGPRDIPVALARKIASHLIIGASVATIEAAQQAEAAGADYLGCGAVFDAQDSKSDASEPRGCEFITEISRMVSIPVVGIGGITAETARGVIDAGACAVAVIRPVNQTDDPANAAKQLIRCANRCV